MSMPLFINGRFLEQPLSGVQRYAREVLTAIDRRLEEVGEFSQVELLTTGREQDLPTLRRVKVRACRSPLTSHLWDQLVLGKAAKDGVLLSLTGSGPLAHRRQLVIIHDASVYRNPDFFSPVYGTLHRQLGRALARTARIGTVSHFSQGELAHFFRLPSASIPVLPNGSQHMQRIVPDLTITQRLRLGDEPFFVTLGNLTRNKNLALPVAAMARLSEAGHAARLVIVGGIDPKVFGSTGAEQPTERVLFAGRLNDGEVAGLLRGAVSLIFPSRYEGFGIPPLEAMRNDCPVIGSDIPAVREVCGDAALYVDPDSPDACAAAMRLLLTEHPNERAARIRHGRDRAPLFDWDRTAALMINEAAELMRSAPAT